jgi:hypothetical protein
MIKKLRPILKWSNTTQMESSVCGNGGRCLVISPKHPQNKTTFPPLDIATIETDGLVALQMIDVNW